MNNSSRSFSSHGSLSDDLKDFNDMANIRKRLIDSSISNSHLAIKGSKLPLRKSKSVRREPEKIELFLPEKEDFASIENHFLPLEPCCSRTLVVRLERIDNLIKKYEDKKKSINNEAVLIVSPRKRNNKTEENSIFINKVNGANFSQEDMPIPYSSFQLESEKNIFTDKYKSDGPCTLNYPIQQLHEYGNNCWSLDCIICKEKFQDRLELHKHASLSHPGMQISFCDICGESFFGKKSLCQHTTSKYQTIPQKSPIKNTEVNEKNQVPVEKIVENPSRRLAKKKSFSLNSKTQNNANMLNELINLETNLIFKNNLSNLNEFNENLFETVKHHNLNLMDNEEKSRCNRRTTRLELKTLNEISKIRMAGKRKTNDAEFNISDNDMQIHIEKAVARQHQKRRKVDNSPSCVIENELEIAKNKKQMKNVSLVNQIDVVPEKQQFNYSCVKSEIRAPVSLIKTEEQITDWFPEDFTSVGCGTGINRQLDSSKEKPATASPIEINCKATRPTKELEKSFNEKVPNTTSLESAIDLPNEVACIDLEHDVDIQIPYSSNYEEETNIPVEEIHESLINQKVENCSIIDEIIVIQLKSDDSEMNQASEVHEDNDICVDFIENFKSSVQQEEVSNCGTETEQSQNGIKKLARSVESSKQNEVELTDEIECIYMVENEKPEVEIIEEDSCNDFGNTDSDECVVMEPTEETRETIPEEAEQDVANNIDNTDSSECVILEPKRDIGEKILEKNAINNIESEDLEKNSQSENNVSTAPVANLQPENNSDEHETNLKKSVQQEENVELSMTNKSNNTINNENGSHVEDSTVEITRGTLKIVDQSILIPPAFSTTWTCTDCSKSFDEYLNLLLHKTEVHRYACTECNKFFDGKSKFLLHMDKLHPIKLRKGLDHAADQVRINELMLEAFKMTKPKESNNNSLKKRKMNTDFKKMSLSNPVKRAKTDMKNKMVIDNLDSEQISSSQPAEQNKSNEVNNLGIDVSGKSESSEKLPAELVKKLRKTKNNKKKSNTLIDDIDSEEKLLPEYAKVNEVNEESNVVIDVSGKTDSNEKTAAKPMEASKKDKNVKRNKAVIANADCEQILSSKSSGESKVEQDSNAIINISKKTNFKKKTPTKSVKTIGRARIVKKKKVDSKQKSASDPVVGKIVEGNNALTNTSGKTNSDLQKSTVESAKLIKKSDSEQKSTFHSMGEEYVNKEKKIMFDVPEEINFNEKSSIDPSEKIKDTQIDQEHMTVIQNIDFEQKSSQSVEENKADVFQVINSKEKSQTKLIQKTKSKKTTNKPDSKKKKPSKKYGPVKKSKTIQKNSKETKNYNSKANVQTSKKRESSKFSKKKLAEEAQRVSIGQKNSTSKNNFETANRIQKDTEAMSDHSTSSNIVSEKKNVNPGSLIKWMTKKSMQDTKTSWMCIKCQQHFVIRHEYILHSFHTHEDMTLISICDKCGEVLTSIESSKNHMCMEVIVWCCQICSMGFTTGLEFVQHNRVHHLEISVLHNCDACYRSFVTETMLAKHQEEHDISNVTLSEIATTLRSDKLKKKSIKISNRKAGIKSSKKSEQTVNKKSMKVPRKKKEKTVKDKKSVKVIVKRSTKVKVKEPVKVAEKKIAKVKNRTKVLTKKPAKAPTNKPTKVSKKKSTKKPTEESTKVSNDQSKGLSETSLEEAEKMEKSKKKPKKPTEKSSKASTGNSLKSPPSEEPVQLLFKKPREFGPRSSKYLPAKFHFFNYQTFQSAFVKIQMPCLFCEDVFRSSAGYINHLLKTHHTSGEECQICRNTFANETMIQHMLAMHAVPSDPNKDSLKPIESFDSINEDKDKPINMDTDFIIRHMDKKRLFLLCQYHAFDHILKNETFLCPWCNKVMEHPRHYKIHFLTAHDKTCVICNVDFEISQVAALHKSKVHGYVGSYLWFAEIIVRTLVNSNRFGATPKDIMIHMIGGDFPIYEKIVDNLTDGKVITDLNNSKNSCNQSTSVKNHQKDISKNDKIANVNSSNDFHTKNYDSSTNYEFTPTNDSQQNGNRSENVIPMMSDNCL
ncbi:uncharacterized protein LOC107265110 [Cephus cinctus]|uniref:Uncharacterized protein LOC107265110 n=1 Tax=Cephus cinctus TaxID=211228 RepID=A0AAJ7FFS5_CEPCN|nr:uncharacterized protein LOC107265110 [Cephus cinctus]